MSENNEIRDINHIKKTRPNMKKIKEKLISKYGCCCSYCQREYFDQSSLDLEHFLPYSKYPDFAFDESNYVLACSNCNRSKSDMDPYDVSGKQVVLHPYKDDWSLHIKEEASGEVTAIDEIGATTIERLNLNSPMLIQYRSEFPISISGIDGVFPVAIFRNSIKSIRKLLDDNNHSKRIEKYYYAMIYSNIISSMEAYLSSVIILLLKCNSDLKWQFVERYGWNKATVSFNSIKKQYDEIDQTIHTELNGLIYHNIPKIQKIFEETLGIEIFSDADDMKDICMAVGVRHDLVHRNGRKNVKNKDGSFSAEYHIIDKQQIENLICLVERMVSDVEKQIDAKNLSLQVPKQDYD